MGEFDWGSEPARHGLAVLACVAYLLLCAWVAWREWRRRQKAARLAEAQEGLGDPVLVAYASQTGFAEQLAQQTAEMLRTAGLPVSLVELSQLGLERLGRTQRALFIVSTCGEGDAPDNAELFVRRVMSQRPELKGLHAAVLALGDSSYADYCGFGQALDAWLTQTGAAALFPRIDVDNADPVALKAWQHALSHLAGTSDLPDWEAPAWQRWRLTAREQLNPGSTGGATYHLELEPESGPLPDWASGDLVQVLAPTDPQRPREYSIASIPADGRVHLLVRQEVHPDGQLGAASGWLTDGVPLGECVELRLRAHRNFQLGENLYRPLVLIGNGTGLAGLRGHLRARVAASSPPTWLVFGERQAAHDAYHRDEIEALLAQGKLAHVDWVFSRDGAEREYVQHRLQTHAQRLRDWVDQGAAIYVCGSLEGMAGGVDAVLRNVLGPEGVERLLEQGRYRRDVY